MCAPHCHTHMIHVCVPLLSATYAKQKIKTIILLADLIISKPPHNVDRAQLLTAFSDLRSICIDNITGSHYIEV